MKITLYYNESEKFAMNKTLNYIGDLTGTLKNATSLLNPNINVEIETNGNITYNIDVQYENNDISYIDDAVEYDVSCMMDSSILKCNYCYIEEFERYYFVDNIIIQNNKLFVLILSVDSLESNKEDVSNQNAFITRNEFDYNPLVKDEQISFYYDKEVTEYIPEKGTKVNLTFNTEMDVIANNIVLSVINKNVQFTTKYVQSPDASLPDIKHTTMGTSATYRLYATYYAELSHLSKRIQADDTLADYILSCMIFPFSIKTTGDDEYLVLGDEILYPRTLPLPDGLPSVMVTDLENEAPQYYVVADFTINGDSFLDYEPYTQYEIYIPYLSWINVSADDILNNRIIIYYVVDYSTGNSQVTLYDITNSKVIYTGTCQLGVKVGLTTTNQMEVNNNRASNNIGLGVGLLTSAVSIIGGVLTYNPVAVAGGFLAGGKSIASYVQNNNTNYSHANGSVSSGLTGLFLPQEVKIRKTRLKPKNYNEDFFKLVGRPLNEYRNIGELKGYTIVGEVHLENIDATKQEIEQIESILKSGFIIE